MSVLVFLLLGSKGVLMQYDSLNIEGAHPREVRKLLPDGRDQAAVSLHPFVIGHGAMRVAHPERLTNPSATVFGDAAPFDDCHAHVGY